MYTKNFNKIALSSNDDKRLQTFDKTTTYPHRTNIFKVCESKMLKVCKAKATLKMLSKECESEMCVKKKRKVNVFKVCESKMWMRNTEVCESEKC